MFCFFYILHYIYHIGSSHLGRKVGIYFPVTMPGCSGGRFLPTVCCHQVLSCAASHSHKTRRRGRSRKSTRLSSSSPRSRELRLDGCAGAGAFTPLHSLLRPRRPHLLECFPLRRDPMAGDSSGQVFINSVEKCAQLCLRGFRKPSGLLWLFFGLFVTVCFTSQVKYFWFLIQNATKKKIIIFRLFSMHLI